MEQRLDEISVIRSIAIIIVVAFHVYGMMYAAHFPSVSETYRQLYWIPNQCIFISVAMPLFTIISGYLFSHLLLLGKYPTWGNLLQKKLPHILLPYWVFTLIFMLTTKDFRWYGNLIGGGYSHLWFLTMLFWCFVLTYALFRVTVFDKPYWAISLLFISFAGTFTPKFMPTFIGLHNVTRWYYWFLLGFLLCYYKDVILQLIGKYRLYIPLLIIYLLYACIGLREYCDDTWYSIVATTSAAVSIWYLFKQVEWRRLYIGKILIWFSTYSFGIYIFHNWIAQFLISTTAQRVLHLEYFATNHTILFPLAFFLTTALISWALTKLLLLTNAGKFLIG